MILDLHEFGCHIGKLKNKTPWRYNPLPDCWLQVRLSADRYESSSSHFRGDV